MGAEVTVCEVLGSDGTRGGRLYRVLVGAPEPVIVSGGHLTVVSADAEPCADIAMPDADAHERKLRIRHDYAAREARKARIQAAAANRCPPRAAACTAPRRRERPARCR